MGAALLGFSLMGPDVGVAHADNTGDSSVSSGASSTDGPSASGSGRKDRGGTGDADRPVGVGANDTGTADTDSDDDRGGRTTEAVEDVEVQRDEDDTDADAETKPPTEDASPRKTRAAVLPEQDAAGPPAPAVPEATEPAPAPRWLAPRRTWNDVVAQIMTDWTSRHETWVESLDVSNERKAELDASFLAMRRGLFNQAPTVAPIQLTGLISGAITGDINGFDAEGDAITYRLIRGPRQGSVVIAGDGTYTYTPDGDFDGVDTFYVRAIDAGVHVNLLNVFRPIGTRADNQINQGAITFEFDYTGADWTAERRQALEEVAASLQEYFRVNKPVTLTFDVNLEDPEDEERGLASASSPNISKLPGYWSTVVQHKLQTGRDANGPKADGEISWNFADFAWGLSDEVPAQAFDFVSTAIHELMHAFGFLTSLGEAGDNREVNRTAYDRHIVTVRGTPAFVFAQWRTRNDPKLTGGEGGLYFGGRNAVAAYGGLVPLYTPPTWEDGSSVHHVDDASFTGDNQKIMNAMTGRGPGVRVFSAFEIGILKDLGYHVVMPETPPYPAGLLGLVFLARRRRTEKPVAC